MIGSARLAAAISGCPLSVLLVNLDAGSQAPDPGSQESCSGASASVLFWDSAAHLCNSVECLFAWLGESSGAWVKPAVLKLDAPLTNSVLPGIYIYT